MAKLDPNRPEEARRSQDVDVPGITLPEGTYHTGRGMCDPDGAKESVMAEGLTVYPQEAQRTNTLPPRASNEKLKSITKKCGRTRSVAMGPRREAASELSPTRRKRR